MSVGKQCEFLLFTYSINTVKCKMQTLNPSPNTHQQNIYISSIYIICFLAFVSHNEVFALLLDFAMFLFQVHATEKKKGLKELGLQVVYI